MICKKWHLFWGIGLMAVALLTGGCFQIKADIDIHEDGSVTMSRTMMGNEFMQDKVEEAKADEHKNNPNVKMENVSDGGMKGFKADTDYTDISSMAKSSNMFEANKGRNNGIQMKKGILFDDYSFDLIFDWTNAGKDIRKLPKDEQEMARAMLSDAKFDVTMNLPYPVDNHNADKVTNEGRTLYWNAINAFLNSETVSIRAVFRIWHKDRLMGLGAVGVILLLAMLSFISKMKKPGQETAEIQKAKNNAILCGVVLLLLAGGTYYLKEQKPVFTEQDIISNINEPKASASEAKVGNSAKKENLQLEEKKQKETAKPAKSSTTYKSQEADVSIRPSAETALGPVDLGMSYDQLQVRLGREEKPSKLDNDGFTHYYYPDLELVVGNGRVESVFSNSSLVQTKRGLRQGDSEQAVLQAYGKPYGKTAYDGSTLYEYQFRSSNNDNCLLRFAVKNGIVDYIGSRIVR